MSVSQKYPAWIKGKIMGKQPIIKMEHIHKFFEKVHALNDVNFEIHPGEVIGLVGDNGAGKSTLIKILSGIHPPTEGKIYFKGKEVKLPSVGAARKIGIETVYQEQAVIGNLSVTKNVFLARELTKSLGPIKYADKKRMEAKTEKLMKNLRLNIASMSQEARFCSGGERQGIAIARAMHFKAKVIILDEPTTALSVKGVKQVLKFIKQLKKEGIPAILIAHAVHHIYPVSDRFVVLSKGKKIADIRKRDISQDKLNKILMGTSKARGLEVI